MSESNDDYKQRLNADHIRRVAAIPDTAGDPLTWPAHIRMMTIREQRAFGIDSSGQLYWNGKLLEVRKKVQLRTLELVLAFIVAVATSVQAAVAMLAWLIPH